MTDFIKGGGNVQKICYPIFVYIKKNHRTVNDDDCFFLFTAVWIVITSFDVTAYRLAKAECQYDAQQLDQPQTNSNSYHNIDVFHYQLYKSIVAALKDKTIIVNTCTIKVKLHKSY